MLSENKTEVKARIMPAEDGSIKVVFFSAPASPPLLGAKAASCAKNAPVEDVTVAESGAEAPLDGSILKTDLAAEEATAAETVDSDRAKAMFAAHKPSADAVFWSKFERPTDPPPARTGVTKNGPALEPVTEDSPALEPVTAGGAPLPSIKEFPEEEPAPAGDADWNVSTKEFPVEEPAPAGIDEWKTPSPSNLVDRSKKTTKNLTPIGRVDPNGFAALLGTDVDEEDLAAVVGSGKASVDKEDLAGVGSGKASVNDAPPSLTTPSGGAGEKTEPISTRSGSRFGKICSSKSLCIVVSVVIGLGCSAFALSSYGSGGVSELLQSVLVPDAAAIPVVDFSDNTPKKDVDPPVLPAETERGPLFAPVEEASKGWDQLTPLQKVAKFVRSARGRTAPAPMLGSGASGAVTASLPPGFFDEYFTQEDVATAAVCNGKCPTANECLTFHSYDPSSQSQVLGCKLLDDTGVIPMGSYPLATPIDTPVKDVIQQVTRLFGMEGIASMIEDGCLKYQDAYEISETGTQYTSASEYKSMASETYSVSAGGGIGFGPIAINAGYSKTTSTKQTTESKNSYMSSSRTRSTLFGSVTNACLSERCDGITTQRCATKYIRPKYTHQWDAINTFTDTPDKLVEKPEFKNFVAEGMLVPFKFDFSAGMTYQLVIQSSTTASDESTSVTKAMDAGFSAAETPDTPSGEATAAIEKGFNNEMSQSGSTTTTTVKTHYFGGDCNWDRIANLNDATGWVTDMQACSQQTRSDLNKLSTAGGIPPGGFSMLPELFATVMSETLREALDIALYHCDCIQAGLGRKFAAPVTNILCYNADGSLDSSSESRLSLSCANMWVNQGYPELGMDNQNMGSFFPTCARPTTFNEDNKFDDETYIINDVSQGGVCALDTCKWGQIMYKGNGNAQPGGCCPGENTRGQGSCSDKHTQMYDLTDPVCWTDPGDNWGYCARSYDFTPAGKLCPYGRITKKGNGEAHAGECCPGENTRGQGSCSDKHPQMYGLTDPVCWTDPGDNWGYCSGP